MRRAVWIMLSVELWAGCVALPDEEEQAAFSDAALSDELQLDGGARRPPIGEPYRGLHCGTNEPGGGDGGLVSAGGAQDASVAPGLEDGGDEPVPVRPMDAAVVPRVPGPARAGDVVITEIMLDPAGRSDTDGEWVELWSAHDIAALSLEGCVLDDGGSTPRKLGAFLLEPLAYVTVGRAASAGFEPDIVAAITLTNTADTVALLCDGVEIDRVSYDNTFPLRAGASLSLDPSAQAVIDNDDPSAWCRGVDDYGGDLGTPGAANPSCTPADGGVP